MALHLRIAAGTAVAAALAHGTWVARERARIPTTPRGLQFGPGTHDDVIASSLRTGDLVLLRRDCLLHGCAVGAACAARQQLGGAEFDAAGVVVIRAGEPWLLERTAGGVRLRPYPARVRCSRAREIAVRPLARTGAGAPPPLTDAALRALLSELGALDAEGRPVRGGGGSLLDARATAAALGEAARISAVDPRHNASLEVVERFYAAMGLERGGASSVPLAMADLAPPAQPWRGTRYAPTVWVRDLL